MPAIHLVYPPSEEIGNDVWFAGHSTWTYSLFSGGVIGLLAHLGLIGGVMAASLSAARANASDPGPDQWLAFLPFVAACCLLSESLTSNPFDERLAAMIFGVMAGLSQSFLVRASWIHAKLRPSLA
jgi:O-antigen ligase